MKIVSIDTLKFLTLFSIILNVTKKLNVKRREWKITQN